MNSEKNEKLKIIFKTMISFLVAAALPAVVGVSYIAGAWLSFPVTNPVGSPADQLLAFGSLLPFSFIVALMHVLIFGVPAFLLGLRFRAINWWTSVIVASAIGIMPLAILFSSSSNFKFFNLLPLGLFGAIGGLTFWVLWRFWVHYQRDIVSL